MHVSGETRQIIRMTVELDSLEAEDLADAITMLTNPPPVLLEIYSVLRGHKDPSADREEADAPMVRKRNLAKE